MNDRKICSHSSYGRLVQINFVLGAVQFLLDDVWSDFGLHIDFDHRRPFCEKSDALPTTVALTPKRLETTF